MKAPRRAWAKTDKHRKGNPPTKTVKSHGTETGIAAAALIDTFFPFLSTEQKNRIIWLAENHDIGKATPEFQRKNQRGYRKSEEEFGHQVLSAAILRKEYGATPYEGKLVGAHHGVHQKPRAALIMGHSDEEETSQLYEYLALGPETMGTTDWETLRKKEIIPKTTSPLPNWERNTFRSGEIAGFITLCDYIASSLPTTSQNWEEDNLESAEVIFKFLEELKLGGNLQFSEAVTDFKSLTNQIPRQFQNLTWAGPGIYLLEAPTGAGKTEAAMYLLMQGLQANDVTGGYFGLPTTLTSNRIFERLKITLQEKVIEGRIQLSHGKSRFQEEPLHDFCNQISPETHNWLCGSARSLATALGVGTIDQALMGTIHTNHWPLRSLCLRNKLIICDEAHSYDKYTTALMAHAIKNWVEKQGCSVLCLSATLSDFKKEELFGGKIPLTKSEFGFSFSTPTETKSLPIEVGDAIAHPDIRLERHLCKTLTPEDPVYQSCLSLAINAAEKGAKVIWISNSVHNAQETFNMVKNDPCVKLLHSRFTAEDRARKEEETLQAFEKDDKKGMLLIGTQVLEQSLDLNADILFCEICPIELLFQRGGRLWRKFRENRTQNGPVFHILLPEENPSQSGLKIFEKTAKVYRDHFQLIRSWHWVKTHDILKKNEVRAALHYHAEPKTPIELDCAQAEAKAAAKATSLAAGTAPSLCKEKSQHMAESAIREACQIEEFAATTRTRDFLQYEFILFQDSQTFWNGKPLENPKTPSWNDRLQMEKNSIRLPAHLCSSNPKEAGEEFQLEFHRYMWIKEGEFSYGLTYHPDLGMVENSRNL
jgi:CRISPR-associated endonuclease/helicase Cas3